MKIIIDSASLFSLEIRRDTDFISNFVDSVLKYSDWDITLLDRGDMRNVGSVSTLPFPRYSRHRFNAEDSILLQKICDNISADFFVSEISTPLTTPMLLLVSDLFQRDLPGGRPHMELRLAAAYSDVILCETPVDEDKISLFHPSARNKLIPSFEKFREIVTRVTGNVADAACTGQSASFRQNWAELRKKQAKVDTVLWDI